MFDNLFSKDNHKPIEFINSPEETPIGAEKFSMQKQKESFGGSSYELKTPFCIAYMEKMKKQYPENVPGMKVILENIDKQYIQNFDLIKSDKFPGTEISYTRLSVTPQLIKDISSAYSDHSASGSELPADPEIEIDQAKKEVAFIFPAMGLPPDGNAFSAEDIGIDRFIRFIPRVTRAMREGQPTPEVEIYVLGSGTGFGEKVSADFVKQVDDRGLDARGEYYAEFVNNILKDEDADHILLQGASMGTMAADFVFSSLPDEVKKKTQRLFDSPAGNHDPSIINRWRGVQAGIGVVVEGGINFFSETGKAATKYRPELIKHILEQKGQTTETEENKNNRFQLFKAAGKKLLQGEPLDLSERTYIRRGEKDLLTFSPIRFIRNSLRRGTKIETHHGDAAEIKVPMKTTGRALEVPNRKAHIFSFENFARWNTIIDYSKKVTG